MRAREIFLLCLTLTILASPGHSQTSGKFGIGRLATPDEITGWNIDIDRKGTNLPPGKGTVGMGQEVFEQQCAACHGSKGEGGVADRLVGGQGTLSSANPVKTVGSYWPYATTLFDYVRRSMPHPSPQSLSNEEVYAVTAYILHLNGLLPANATLDARSLPSIKMPNRDNFVGDTRPDVR
jgi:hypothetical protein